jgi:acyl carrier protein
VHLDVLPKAPNGKLDRRALPAPGRARPTLDQPPVAPRTPVETALCAIWREVLDLDEVGVTDAFLDLGGTSLAAGRILARLAETFRVDLPLRLLFEAPTVAGLAAALAARGVGASDPAAQERLLGELEGLSEAEAERLLAAGQPAPQEAGHE